MVVRIVEVDDVDPVQAEPLQAVLDRAAHAQGAEVPDPAVGGGHGETLGKVVAVQLPGRAQQPADLGGEDVLVPGAAAQGLSEPSLGQAQTVMRSRVEIPDTRLPRSGNRGLGIGIGHRREQVADPRRTEGEFADLHLAASQGPAVRAHDRASGRSRRPAIPPSTCRAVPVVLPAAGEAR